jgi:nitronate monooxygenase
MSATRPLPFKLSLPLIAAPMFLISGPELVLAACAQGIVGAFPTPNCRTSEALEDWMRQMSSGYEALKRAHPDRPIGPWAATMVTHRSNDRFAADLALVEKYRPPMVITALGGPRPVIDAVHAYGGLVFADVNNMTLAKKAADAGVDGLVLVCSGAGGHTGEIAGFAFLPAVRKWWDGYIVYAGGVCSGSGIRAAQVLGADLAYMGTVFIATHESMAETEYKQMLVDCGPGDIVLTKAFTGATASMLRPTIVRAGLDPDNLPPRKDMEFRGQNSTNKPWKGIWGAGHAIGMIDRVKSVAELVGELREQYAAVGAQQG